MMKPIRTEIKRRFFSTNCRIVGTQHAASLQFYNITDYRSIVVAMPVMMMCVAMPVTIAVLMLMPLLV